MKRTMITAALAAALAFANPAIAASPTIPAKYRGEVVQDGRASLLHAQSLAR